MGYGGAAKLVLQDNETVLYQYGCYNLNMEGRWNLARKMDGEICIDIASIPEPEVHSKKKRFPNGKKKLVIRKLPVTAAYTELYNTGKIQIQNCPNAWKTRNGGGDMIAWYLIFRIFESYQINGVFPENVSCDA